MEGDTKTDEWLVKGGGGVSEKNKIQSEVIALDTAMKSSGKMFIIKNVLIMG